MRHSALPIHPQRLPLDLFSSSTVDEEFETVSTQLLKRTQAMLNKYRLLLLEESRVRWPSSFFPGDPALPTCREGGTEAGGQITRKTV